MELELEVKEREFEHENILRSCCFKVDKRMLDALLKIGLTSGIMIFACVQIAKDTPEKQVWISLLTGFVGYLLPSPTLHKLN